MKYYTLIIRDSWSQRLDDIADYIMTLSGQVLQINDILASIEVFCIPEIIPQLSLHPSVVLVEEN